MKIAAIVVTYNRIHDLKIAIRRYEQQTYPVSYLIIVDNASSDGTKEFLEEWREKETVFRKTIIRLKKNSGGSGGFYTGLKYAFDTDCDWYWFADDDAFLDFRAFEELDKFSRKNKQLILNNVALSGSVVLDPETNEYDLGHRRTIKKKFGMPIQKIIDVKEYNKEYFNIGLFTFVGSLVKAESAKKAGLPHGDFFIYYDDIEYSYRLGKFGSMYCVPSCKIYHNTGKHEEKYGSNWRSYYQSRNMMLFYKEHFPLAFYKMIGKRIIQKIVLNLFGKYSSVNQLDWDAMIDAIRNGRGISKKYYIGWKQMK